MVRYLGQYRILGLCAGYEVAGLVDIEIQSSPGLGAPDRPGHILLLSSFLIIAAWRIPLNEPRD
jgi:hypothetical protein